MIMAARRLPLTAPLRLLIFRRGFGSANDAIQNTFRASDLQITTVSPYKKRPKPKEDQPLGFGNHFADHMLEVDWDIDNGWHKPCIKPYENLSLDPAAKVLHYAPELFEGLKAYRGDDGRIRLFRPQLNMERMRRSAHRAALPDFDGSQLIECMKRLIAIDRDWVPKMKGASLYVRPTLIGTEPNLGVSYSNKAKLFVITGPVGSYFSGAFSAIKLLADAKYVRAAKGGVGAYKMGCNYAPTLEIAREAEGMGCNQVLWLSGPEHFVAEAGAMNVFMYWKNENGEDELITPTLESGIILPGVTRRSMLDLAREMGIKVSERDFTMDEVVRASNEKRVYEFFGTGTAVVVSPIDRILYKVDGREIELQFPSNEEKSIMKKLFTTITDIQFGRQQRPEWTIEI